MSVPSDLLKNINQSSTLTTIKSTLEVTPIIPLGIAAVVSVGIYLWGNNFATWIHSRVKAYRDRHSAHQIEQISNKYSELSETLQRQRSSLKEAWKNLCSEHTEFYETYKKHSYSASKKYLDLLLDEFLDIDLPLDTIIHTLNDLDNQYRNGNETLRADADQKYVHLIEGKIPVLMMSAKKTETHFSQLLSQIHQEFHDREIAIKAEKLEGQSHAQQVAELRAKIQDAEARICRTSFLDYQGSKTAGCLVKDAHFFNSDQGLKIGV